MPAPLRSFRQSIGGENNESIGMCTSLTYSRASVALASALNALVFKRLHFVKLTPSVAQSSASIGLMCRASKMYVRSIERRLKRGGYLQLTLFAVDTPASLSQRPGNGAARQTTATSGLKCLGLSANYGPLGSLERILLGTLRWGSTMCFLTWKTRATPQGRLLFQLAPSMPRTGEIGFGLWPTPTVHGNNNRKGLTKKSGDGLATAVRMWPTPRASYRGDCPSERRRRSPDLLSSVRMEQEGSSPEIRATGTLNPAWVEWLMGYPVGWTEISPSETPFSRKSRK